MHIYSTIHYQNDDKSKLAVDSKLTKKIEKQTHGESAWRMADAPKDYLNVILENIVAFWIKIARIPGKSKLSQNREAIDFENVANLLVERGYTPMAARMNQIRKTQEED